MDEESEKEGARDRGRGVELWIQIREERVGDEQHNQAERQEAQHI